MSQQFSHYDDTSEYNDRQNISYKKNFFDFEDEDECDYTFQPVISQSETNKSEIQTNHPAKLDSTLNNSGDNYQDNNAQSKLFDFILDDSENKIAELISSLKLCTNITNISTSSSISPRLAIEKLIAGDTNVNLCMFRGKEQKLELLDYALLTCNPYAITKVVLFLQETLKPSIFHYEITRRPVAADHYLLYLKKSEQVDTLLNSLAMLGRHEDAAFAMYARAVQQNSNEVKLKLLNRTLSHYFTTGGSELLQWQTYIKDHIALLEQQMPIEVDDSRREQEETSNPLNELEASTVTNLSNLFVIYPRPKLLGLPVIETLHYCCFYHYHLQDNNFASPVYIRKRFSLTEKQFLWTALQALAKCGQWTEIDNLFEYKSWLGSRKIKNNIPIDQIVTVLFLNSAPPQMLEKYLELVDDIERRLQLAKDSLMTKFVADILIKLRDRKRLSDYRASIQTTNEVDYVQRYIDNALRSSTIKWKN